MMTDEARMQRVENSVTRLENIVLFGEGEKPSLVVSLDRLSTQIDTAVRTVKALWPVLLIIAILLLSNTFFGPAIRKGLGLPETGGLHTQSEYQLGGNAFNVTLAERKNP